MVSFLPAVSLDTSSLQKNVWILFLFQLSKGLFPRCFLLPRLLTSMSSSFFAHFLILYFLIVATAKMCARDFFKSAITACWYVNLRFTAWEGAPSGNNLPTCLRGVSSSPGFTRARSGISPRFFKRNSRTLYLLMSLFFFAISNMASLNFFEAIRRFFLDLIWPAFTRPSTRAGPGASSSVTADDGVAGGVSSRTTPCFLLLESKLAFLHFARCCFFSLLVMSAIALIFPSAFRRCHLSLSSFLYCSCSLGTAFFLFRYLLARSLSLMAFSPNRLAIMPHAIWKDNIVRY